MAVRRPSNLVVSSADADRLVGVLRASSDAWQKTFEDLTAEASILRDSCKALAKMARQAQDQAAQLDAMIMTIQGNMYVA